MIYLLVYSVLRSENVHKPALLTVLPAFASSRGGSPPYSPCRGGAALAAIFRSAPCTQKSLPVRGQRDLQITVVNSVHVLGRWKLLTPHGAPAVLGIQYLYLPPAQSRGMDAQLRASIV